MDEIQTPNRVTKNKLLEDLQWGKGKTRSTQWQKPRKNKNQLNGPGCARKQKPGEWNYHGCECKREVRRVEGGRRVDRRTSEIPYVGSCGKRERVKWEKEREVEEGGRPQAQPSLWNKDVPGEKNRPTHLGLPSQGGRVSRRRRTAEPKRNPEAPTQSLKQGEHQRRKGLWHTGLPSLSERVRNPRVELYIWTQTSDGQQDIPPERQCPKPYDWWMIPNFILTGKIKLNNVLISFISFCSCPIMGWIKAFVLG